MEEQKDQKKSVPAKKSAWKSILGKKWAFPAIYISSAAIILAFVMWYQGSLVQEATQKPLATDTVTVNEGAENPGNVIEDGEAVAVDKQPLTLSWPAAKEAAYDLGMGFFNEEATADEQAKTMVKFNDNTFVPHLGIDLVSKDGKAFDVTAAQDGKVTKVYNDQLVGNLIEIEHADKLVTVYQSLESIKVKANDEVKQGQVIGVAGRNDFEKELKAHLHFEVRQDGNYVDPHQLIKTAEAQ